ncbi:hypothetical protein GOL30_22065 [Sinorhizobium medicae]|uniref:hypothetical protein n=1 Tax=Sinorhizobium medicae TaxID=110321 RepID=UPI000FE029BF|nr:hypothetical protein [Sinorhizobium medicae]MDX0431561.1 hypothetical protein [Sinorhizobium medicae]MDX0686183.1 hypothetical protein [Sinorhizobium medicae]MDX0838444.1 hypothetical protein [Sinorhizobium medicae]MDX0919598.1 hypothetical protein [Sinorhizobium medicae]MDX0961772.1 hypothetical protein [Sinorhizobium medicae]
MNSDRTRLGCSPGTTHERKRASGGALRCPQLDSLKSESPDRPPEGHGRMDVSAIAVEGHDARAGLSDRGTQRFRPVSELELATNHKYGIAAFDL